MTAILLRPAREASIFATSSGGGAAKGAKWGRPYNARSGGRTGDWGYFPEIGTEKGKL